MLKKFSSKVFLIICIFVLPIIIMGPAQKYVRRLLHIPITVETIESSDSEYLNMLIGKSKFSNSWQWNLIITNQFDDVNYDSSIDELATRTFIGYHKGHDVRFIHTITKYMASPSELNLDPMWKGYGVEPTLGKISIPIPQDSTFLPVVCYSGLEKPEAKIVRCVLVRKQGNIHERIDLDVYGETNIEILSEFVKSIVMVFNHKEDRIK